MTTRIGFVGAGKMGVSLGRYLKNNGLCVSGYHDCVAEAAQHASRHTATTCHPDLSDLLDASDMVFVTVPDDRIAAVWDACRQHDIRGKCFSHCSGVLGSDVFSGHLEAGAFACSAHPVCTVRSRDESEVFAGKYFVIEGDETGLQMLQSILGKTNNAFRAILNADKAKYHAATVAASNLICALAQMAENLLHDCGFDNAEAHELLRPLMRVNMDNIADNGCTEALTGPVERNDAGTVTKHLSALESSEREIYRLLSLRLVDMARLKHPERNYATLFDLLKK